MKSVLSLFSYSHIAINEINMDTMKLNAILGIAMDAGSNANA